MKKRGYIYVDAKTSKYVANYLPRIFMAKGMQKITQNDIIINTETVDDNLIKIAEMYGCRICVMRRNPIASIRAIIMAIYFIGRKFDREYILNYHYKNMPVGGFLYDTLVRINNKRITIDHIRRIDFDALRWSFKEIICVYDMFCKKTPTAYFTNETGHLAGCTAMMAAHMGGHVFTCTLSGRIHYLGHGDDVTVFLYDIWRMGFEDRWNKGFPDDFAEEVDRYMCSRTSGKVDVDSHYAFLNKKVVNRDEYVRKFGLDADKKNVVIMCHCFSDTPHMSCAPKLYTDYYVWFVETLKIISKIKNVNWIIKAHPSRELYEETEEVNELFVQYGNRDNMWLWDDGYSTESLFDIADAVITVAGTCGIEFPCYGIPAIIAGDTFYSKHGCTIMPTTIEEYEDILKHLDKINKLSEEQIQMAKKVMYASIHIYEPFDQLDQYLLENSMVAENSEDDVSEANRKVMEYIAKNSTVIQSCHFTEEGRNWGKKLFQ